MMVPVNSSPRPSEPLAPPTPPALRPRGTEPRSSQSPELWHSGSTNDSEEEDEKEERDNRQVPGEDSWQLSCSMACWGLLRGGGLWEAPCGQLAEGGDIEEEEEVEEKPVLQGETLAWNPQTPATMDIWEEQRMAVRLRSSEAAPASDGEPAAVEE